MPKINDNEIQMFYHCKSCSENRNTSPREWGRYEIGVTKKGFQVRCVRCDKNVVHWDLMGQKVGIVHYG